MDAGLKLSKISASIAVDNSWANKALEETARKLAKFESALQKADADITKTEQDLKGLGRAASKAAKDVDKSTKSWTVFAAQLYTIKNMVRMVAYAFGEVYDAAEEGARNTAAREFFENAGKDIQRYREATRGMVSDAELMKKANLADSMGISQSTFMNLVQVAEASALKTGLSFDLMFDSIIKGTARSSRLLLDNLGIIVSVEAANKNYASSHHKLAEALTDTEKKAAFVEEVQRQSIGTIDEWGRVADTTSVSFAQLNASLENTGNIIKEGLAKSLASSGIMAALTSFLNNIRDAFEGGGWYSLGEYLGYSLLEGLSRALAIANPLTPLLMMIDSQLKSLGSDVSLASFMPNNMAAESLKGLAEGALTRARESGSTLKADNVQVAANTKDMLAEILGPEWESAVERFVQTGKVATSGTEEVIKQFLAANRAAMNIYGEFKKSVRDAGGKTSNGSGGSRVKEGQNADWLMDQAMDKWQAEYDKQLDKEAVARKKAALALEKMLDDETYRDLDLIEEKRKAQRALLKQFGKDASGGVAKGLGEGSGLFEPLLSALSPLVSTIPVIGPALAGLLPIIGALIDGLKPVTDLIAGFSEGLSLLVTNGLGQFLGALGILQEPIRNLLAAVGLLIGSALRPFVLILNLVVFALGAVIQALAFVVTALAPFAEIIMQLVSVLWSGGLSLLSMFIDLDVMIAQFGASMLIVVDFMQNAVIRFNNAIVSFMRNTLGAKGFGKYLSKEDFKLASDANDENTKALDENTKALRDFTREFRNLPANYKVNRTIFATQAAEVSSQGRRGLNPNLSDVAGNLQRWRT